MSAPAASDPPGREIDRPAGVPDDRDDRRGWPPLQQSLDDPATEFAGGSRDGDHAVLLTSTPDVLRRPFPDGAR
jgi:hypothetical protein